MVDMLDGALNQNRAEQELKESEEKFRSITEQSFMGIAIIQDGNIKYVNETISKIFGYSMEELMNWSAIEFFKTVHPEDRDIAMERVRKKVSAKLKDSPVHLYRIFTKSGKIKWIDSYSKNIQYQGKNALLATLVDVTEKKKAEQKIKESEEKLRILNKELEQKVIERTKELMESERKLRKQNIELKKIDKIKNDFITMAAHELKTPLVSIFGYTDYILTKYKEELNPEMKEDLLIVQKNIERLKNYMNQLLDVMKIDENKLKLNKEMINFSKLINDCINELSYLIQEKNHDLILNIDDGIILNLDLERIFQVLSNLLSNAIKFTPINGKIEINAEKVENQYYFKVKDNGVGLNKDELECIFNKFETIKQLNGDQYNKEKGTGLGLYISKGIIEAHGGTISAISEGKNKGTTFTFTLPL